MTEHHPEQTSADWTRGPAKHAAIIALAGLAVAALGLSTLTQARRWREVPVVTGSERAAVAPAMASSQVQSGAAVKIVNINSASSAELDLLPGIGPALAQRIVESRERDGLFRSVHDLDRVKGIGPSLVEKLEGLVTCIEEKHQE